MTRNFTYWDGKKFFYPENVDFPPIWFGPICGVCGADLGEIGFHGDGCSYNGPYKPIDTKALREFLKGNKK